MATTTELFAEALHIAWMSWVTGMMKDDGVLSQTTRDSWTKAMVPFEELPEEYKSQNCDYARKVLTAMGMNETLEKAAAYDSLARQLSDITTEVERLKLIEMQYESDLKDKENELLHLTRERNDAYEAIRELWKVELRNGDYYCRICGELGNERFRHDPDCIVLKASV